MRPPATAIEVLRKANDKGEIGYAHGGDNEDWPAVQECIDNGWIEFERDASIGCSFDFEGRPFQKRTIYRITEAGRLKSAKGAVEDQDDYEEMPTEALQEYSNYLYQKYLEGGDYLNDLHRIAVILRTREAGRLKTRGLQ